MEQAWGEATMTTQQWDIPLRDGRTVTHKRFDKADGSKRFEFWLDGKMGLDGMPKTDIPLYGSERLTDDNIIVVLTEGEKDTDALLERKCVAVGTVTGANQIPCDESLKELVGRRVYLWADNDPEPFKGQLHMKAIAERLWKLGNRNIRMVEWEDAPPKGGAADFTGSKEELGELLKASTPFEKEEVDTAALLNEISGLVRKYLVLAPQAADR